MSFLESNKKVFLILFSIYFLVNIPMLLNFNGIYWDDWTLVGHSLETLNRTFFDAVGYAGYATSYLHYFMINELGIYSYRLFTFILLFLSGWFVFKILSTIYIFSLKDRFFITILFLTAPLYSAKIALIDFPYTFYSFLFFLGFLILSSYIYRLNLFVRVMVLIIFFFSFFLNSLLVFYAVVLLYIFYKIYNTKLNFIQNSILFVKTKIDFIILPILFFVVKSIWFVSSGLYGTYNKISIFAILNPAQYIKGIGKNFFEPIFASLEMSSNIIVFLLILIFIVNIFFKTKEIKPLNKKNTENIILLFIGIIIFILAILPYIAVGKMPEINSLSSRFQVLLPLGFSIMLYYSILSIFQNNTRKYVLIILIFSFIIFNIKDQFAWNIDWQYQQSIKQNIEDSEIIKNNSTFLVINQLNDKFYNSRKPPFYEFSGISKQALGTDDKLFVYKSEDVEEYKKIFQYKHYNISNWIESNLVKIYFINIQSSNSKILKTILKLKYLEIFDKESYKIEVKKLVEIK